MDLDFDNPKFDPENLIKSYSKHGNPVKSTEKTAIIHGDDKAVVNKAVSCTKAEELTTKDAVSYLLAGTLNSKVCRYCLNVTIELFDLEREMEIAHKKGIYSIAVKDMVASFHPFKVSNESNLPNKICDKCLDRTIHAYLFTQQCDQAERAIINCLEDIQTKLQKLDPIGGKKRGRRPLHPNYNKIKVEHTNVIDYAEPIIQIVNTTSEALSAVPGLNPLECLKCSHVFPDALSLANHSQIHPKNMWFNCRLCGNSFPKVYLLRRHIQREHLYPKPKQIDDKNVDVFECKTCGEVNEKYYSHIQHIEKHKFKTVMEHLVHGKMDKLCSVCLDKPEGSLVPLNKSVCIHGGPPDLMGERTMQSILTSTVPEKLYKYRELYVANYAKITSMPKKHSERHRYYFSNPKILKINNFKDEINEALFLFSEPNNTMIEIDDLEVHTVNIGKKIDCAVEVNLSEPIDKEVERIFIFSSPVLDDSMIDTQSATIKFESGKDSVELNTKKELKRVSNTSDDEISAKVTKYGSKITEGNHKHVNVTNEMNLESVNIETTGHKVNKTNFDENSVTKKDISEIITEECYKANKTNDNRYVVHDKKTGEICATPTIINDEITAKGHKLNTTDENLDVISYVMKKGIANEYCKCWLFDKQCHFCEKPYESFDETKKYNVNNVAYRIYDRTSDITNKYNENNNNKYVKTTLISSKIYDSVNNIVELNIWQCNTCLTENKDRETCFCCEATNPIHFGKEVKFNFKKTLSYYALNDANDDKPLDNTLPATDVTENTEVLDMQNNLVVLDKIESNNNDTNYHRILDDKLYFMDVTETDVTNSVLLDKIDTNNNVPETTQKVEEMDVDETEIQTCATTDKINDYNVESKSSPQLDAASMDCTPSPNSKSSFSKSFQFNIGSSEKGRRKIKRGSRN